MQRGERIGLNDYFLRVAKQTGIKFNSSAVDLEPNRIHRPATNEHYVEDYRDFEDQDGPNNIDISQPVQTPESNTNTNINFNLDLSHQEANSVQQDDFNERLTMTKERFRESEPTLARSAQGTENGIMDKEKEVNTVPLHHHAATVRGQNKSARSHLRKEEGDNLKDSKKALPSKSTDIYSIPEEEDISSKSSDVDGNDSKLLDGDKIEYNMEGSLSSNDLKAIKKLSTIYTADNNSPIKTSLSNLRPSPIPPSPAPLSFIKMTEFTHDVSKMPDTSEGEREKSGRQELNQFILSNIGYHQEEENEDVTSMAAKSATGGPTGLHDLNLSIGSISITLDATASQKGSRIPQSKSMSSINYNNIEKNRRIFSSSPKSNSRLSRQYLRIW